MTDPPIPVPATGFLATVAGLAAGVGRAAPDAA